MAEPVSSAGSIPAESSSEPAASPVQGGVSIAAAPLEVDDDSSVSRSYMGLKALAKKDLNIPSSSYTASLTSSVVDYPEEYGRTYHAFRAGSYNFPNDEVAVPPNVKFEVDDVESAWIVDEKYDFIFSRGMAASITDWPKLIARIYENLAPNGWAEFEDMSVIYGCDDETVTEDLALMKWARIFAEACQKLGREDSPGPKLEGWVRQTPFKNVVHQHFKIPLGPWAKDAHNKDLGMCNLAQTLEVLDAFTLKLFIGVLGWTREVVVLLAQVRQDLKNSAIHAYLNYHVVYGQKIEDDDGEDAED
ncbi:hypothetical protein CSAL01_11624 [Colletotrichum salicis]|uniref:Methyltransferase domain-containing protein n=1 Tax=Colletotrichum salicis TaxID=1209931 RepID=A0A135T7C7_9PEZI|nr:hypothetical protein CSAL01_11624 [Colletotrichum salicis]